MPHLPLPSCCAACPPCWLNTQRPPGQQMRPLALITVALRFLSCCLLEQLCQRAVFAWCTNTPAQRCANDPVASVGALGKDGPGVYKDQTLLPPVCARLQARADASRSDGGGADTMAGLVFCDHCIIPSVAWSAMIPRQACDSCARTLDQTAKPKRQYFCTASQYEIG